MKNDNELLEYIYQDAKMGTTTITTLIKTINETDNKIKHVIEDLLKEYESYLNQSEKLLKKNKINPKEKGILANMGAFIGIKSEMMKDNSDSRIADMLIKGFSMGSLDLEKKISNFDEKADKNILNLAKKMKKMQEKEIELLKEYL